MQCAWFANFYYWSHSKWRNWDRKQRSHGVHAAIWGQMKVFWAQTCLIHQRLILSNSVHMVSSWCCNPHSPSVSLSSCFVPLLSLIRLQPQLLQLLCITSVFDTTAISAVAAALYHFCLWYDCNPSCCSCFVPLLSLIRLQSQLLQLLCITSVFDTTAISAVAAALYHFCLWYDCNLSCYSCFVPLLSLIRLQSQLLQLLCTTSVFDTTAIPAVAAALYHFCFWYDCNLSCCSCFVPLLSLIRLQPQLLQLLCTTSVFDTTAISAVAAALYHFCFWYDCNLSCCSCFVPLLSLIRLQSQLLQLLCITSVFDTTAISAVAAALYHFCLWYDCNLSCYSCFVPLLSLIRLQSQLLQLLCITSVFDTTATSAATAALYHFCLWYDCNPSCCSCFVSLLFLIRLQPQLLQLLCITSVFDMTAI